MNTFLTEPIILSGEQAMEFIVSLRRPDIKYLDRRNAIFSQIDESISIQRNGLDMEVEIPGLELSFIDEMQENGRHVSLELSTEASFYLDQMDIVGKFFEKGIKENITIVAAYDYKESMERVECVYNETGKESFEVCVKSRTCARMIEVNKIEQMTFAA